MHRQSSRLTEAFPTFLAFEGLFLGVDVSGKQKMTRNQSQLLLTGVSSHSLGLNRLKYKKGLRNL